MTKQSREQAWEIQRRVRNAVREAVSARRIQSSAGPITEKATDEILFRGSHDIAQALTPYPIPVAYALVPSVVRFMLQSFLEIDAAEIPVEGGLGWFPTAENVNALPEGIRGYVHDFETRCDPAHDIQRMARQADTIRALHAKVEELKVDLATSRKAK